MINGLQIIIGQEKSQIIIILYQIKLLIINTNNKNNQKEQGIHLTDDINIAEKKAKVYNINNKSYKIILKIRVKNIAKRKCNFDESNNYLVVNGTDDEIRPIRILYKELLKESKSNND